MDKKYVTFVSQFSAGCDDLCMPCLKIAFEISNRWLIATHSFMWLQLLFHAENQCWFVDGPKSITDWNIAMYLSATCKWNVKSQGSGHQYHKHNLCKWEFAYEIVSHWPNASFTMVVWPHDIWQAEGWTNYQDRGDQKNDKLFYKSLVEGIYITKIVLL